MKRGMGVLPAKTPDAGPVPSLEWTSLEAEFFEREADLYRATPIETFDDLDKS